jgi:hypothetical protein
MLNDLKVGATQRGQDSRCLSCFHFLPREYVGVSLNEKSRSNSADFADSAFIEGWRD